MITSAQFITSAAKIEQCPPPLHPEFAFFGRSNVGKSSLINTLTQRKSLAKASNTPWKTRLFNFFLINEQRQIVDLPGYGYAKTNDKEKKSWLDTIQKFLTTRKTLKKVFLLIDGSIPPQKIDLEMIKTLVAEQINFTIIFTKIDKVSQKEKAKNLKEFQNKFHNFSPLIGRNGEAEGGMFQISNKTWKGRDELLNYIESLL